MPFTSPLLLFLTLAITTFSLPIVLPPPSISATQISHSIDSINDCITHLANTIHRSDASSIVSDLRRLSSTLSTATGNLTLLDAVDDESAAFIVENLKDELQPNVQDVLDAMVAVKGEMSKAGVEQKLLGWLQEVRKKMQKFGTGLMSKVPLGGRRKALRKVVKAVVKGFDAVIAVYGGGVGITPSP